MTTGTIVAELMGTLGVAVLAVVVLLDNAARTRRLREYASASGRRGPLRRWRAVASAAADRTRFGRSLQHRLRGAGLGWDTLEVMVGVTGLGVLLAAVLRPLVGTLGGVVVVALTWVAVNRWLESRRQKRLEAFVGQLPDVARMLSNAAAAGLALRAAIAIAGRELDDPAGTELRAVADRLALGRSLDQALEELAERLPSRELAVLVQTLVIQSRAGGALVSALLNIAATLEQRKELRREVRTAVAGAVFSSYAVVGIGAGAVLVMNMLSPGALDQLATTLVGRLVLLVSSIFFGVGFVLINRLTRIEV